MCRFFEQVKEEESDYTQKDANNDSIDESLPE